MVYFIIFLYLDYKSMAPKVTTGKGKPPITKEEKAKALKITIKEYEKRAEINSKMREYANKYIGDHSKGVSSDKTDIFIEAWKKARERIKREYKDVDFAKLKINIDGPPKTPKKT